MHALAIWKRPHNLQPMPSKITLDDLAAMMQAEFAHIQVQFDKIDTKINRAVLGLSDQIKQIGMDIIVVGEDVREIKQEFKLNQKHRVLMDARLSHLEAAHI